MGVMVGSESKSRLTEKVLSKVRGRAVILHTQALLVVHEEMGPDAKLSAGDYGQLWLLSYQAALMEEQVADIKTIKDA